MRSSTICTLHKILLGTKSRRMRWTGHVACMRNAFNILVGRSEGKKPLGRSKRRWEDNIKIDLREIGFQAVN
jgi:hypothetical protein